MKENIAIVWIRDGVLVDRMPENAVAFALASLQNIHPDLKGDICIEDMINWAFEKSGVSAAEKMRLFNEKKVDIIRDIPNAEVYYNALVSEVEGSLEYFDGSVELLSDLKKRGAKNYITSTIAQEILDRWIQTTQG